MSALILTDECSGAVSDFLHAFGIEDSQPDHDACPGSRTTPGVLGGWQCSCPCHLSGYTQTACPGGPMTANEDALVDLDRIEGDVNGWPPSIHDIRALIAELRTLRASIGPDSERIRELEAALPGPDDIVVSREALETVLGEQQLHPYGDEADCPECAARATLRAALSQPHPAQEQQT